MKKQISVVFFSIFALFACFAIIGCASAPPPEPVAEPSKYQDSLNSLPEIPVAGKKLKFEFAGNTWTAKASGKAYSKGTFTEEATDKGSILTLKQTHLYSDKENPLTKQPLGWVNTLSPDIVLEYKEGPPKSLKLK